jgi:hypothetical protein
MNTVVIHTLLALTMIGGPPAETDKVLVLDNQRVLVGDVQRVEDQYRVTRDSGETWVPARTVLGMFRDLESAYRALSAGVKPRDADGHLQLARWCHSNGLTSQAAAEAQAAADLQPERADVREYLAMLQRTAAHPPARTPPPAVPQTLTVSEPPMVECSPETLALFTTKIQPILMNTCIACHGGEHVGNFRLLRVSSDYRDARHLTQQNIAAALALVNPEKSADGLLAKAVTAHGGATLPPLRNAQAPAYKLLDQWVRQAAKDRGPQPVAKKPSPEVPAEIRPASATEPAPAKPAGDDPFDPGAFNREAHPGRKPDAAPPKP